MVMGAILAGLWSVLFGLPSARVKGFYLIMTTMAAQFVTVDFIITQHVSRVGGREQSFSLPPGTITVGPWVIDTDLKVYYLMIGLVILCTVGMANLLRTRVGRAWIAIRDNDIAAETMGVNVVRYKLLAFFVAGVLGGIAGGFWISSLYVVSAEHFQFSWSLWLVGVILIGGIGSLHGVIFGSIFVTVVLEALQFAVIPLSDAFPALSTGFLYIKEGVFGLAIVLFLLYEPRGLAYRWQQMKNYFNLWPFAY
jgi:branched-chain amino acid transport system permease protein